MIQKILWTFNKQQASTAKLFVIRGGSITQINIFTDTVTDRESLMKEIMYSTKLQSSLAKPRGALKKQQKAVQKQSPKETVSQKNMKACQFSNQNVTTTGSQEPDTDTTYARKATTRCQDDAADLVVTFGRRVLLLLQGTPSAIRQKKFGGFLNVC